MERTFPRPKSPGSPLPSLTSVLLRVFSHGSSLYPLPITINATEIAVLSQTQESYALKASQNWPKSFLPKWQGCVSACTCETGGLEDVGVGWGPRLSSSSLSFAAFLFSSVLALPNLRVKSPFVYKLWQVLKMLKKTVGPTKCSCSCNVFFRLPLFYFSRCKAAQSTGTTPALLARFSPSLWNGV